MKHIEELLSSSKMKKIISQETSQIQSIRLGEKCSNFTRCVDGGDCFNGICQCGSKLVQSGSSCLLRSTIVGRIQNPGESCRLGVFCDGGSSCVNNLCKCPFGLVPEGKVCTPILARAGGKCLNGERCSFGSICIQGICTCPKGFVNADGNCISVGYDNIAKTPEENCINNPHICTMGTQCRKGKCTCPIGTEFIGEACIPTAINAITYVGPGGHCTDGVLCTGNSICANNFCVCPGGERIQNDMCVSLDSQADPGQMCEEDVTVCTGNSQCLNEICTCASGQISLNGQCVHIISQVTTSPIRGCSMNYECSINSMCIQGRCQCNKGFSFINGHCLSQCTSQCDPNATCQEGSCRCRNGFISSGSSCIPLHNHILKPNPYVGAPGQMCDTRSGAIPCSGRSQCVHNQCVCPMNLVLSEYECVEFAGDRYPGQDCIQPGTICRGGSSCSDGICKCEFGLVPSGVECVKSTGSYNPFIKVFTFNPNMFTPFSTLLPYLELRPGATCDSQCQAQSCLQRCGGDSLCTNGRCTCPSGTYDYEGTCIPLAIDPITHSPSTSTRSLIHSARPGDRCDVTILCTGGSTCILGTCTCDQGYIPSFDRSSCIFAVTPLTQRSYPGGECVRDDDCAGNSICIKRICSCQNNDELKDNECVKSLHPAFPGSSCVSLPCSNDSVCYKGYCVCPIGSTTNSIGQCSTSLQNNTSWILPGASCVINSTACKGGSECRNGYCLCPLNMQNTGAGVCRYGSTGKTYSQKLPTPQPLKSSKSLGSSCSLQSECSSIPHSTCIDFQCSCISGYQIREDVCAKKVSKKACTTYKDCDSPRICSTRNTCDCPFTMIESDSGVCLYRESAVSLGSYCSDEIKCSGTSKCLNHLCVCPNGTVEHNSQCMPQMTVLPGSSCIRGEVCGGGSICTSGICICTHGITTNKKMCKSIEKRDVEGQLLLSSNDTVSPCPTDGSCKLPNCFCSKTGMAIPGGFRPKEIPQMVILSFDDAITDRTINIYKSLFNGKHRNPNGCPIKGTFFISHQWNNYDQTQWVHSKGNEIAVNSITHETLSRSTKERWRHEMVGLRDSLKAFSYIEDASIKGIRAPQLLLGGDAQFEMMKENGFLYDNSMSVKEGPVWPQTLDHQLAWDCGEQNCPRKAHKGLWEIPLQLLQANDGIWHTMAKTTIKPYDTRDSVRQMLRRNFYRNYKSNRAPFILTADTDFLTYLPDNGVVHAIEDWLEEILNKTDVYVVTTVQAIQWMSDPSSLSNIEKFRPWQCNVRLNDFIHPCENPSICSYPSISPSGVAHSFRVCGSCPKAYPWIEDPLGKKQMNRKH